MKKGLTAHVMLKNEERWVWYSLMSVIDYVDKIIIFDTGSTDETVSLVKGLFNKPEYKEKIYFEEIGEVSSKDFYALRQRQIDLTETEWFLVLDGDEIWYESSIKELRQMILSEKFKYQLVAIRFHNAVGDVFHFKSFESESYRIKGIVGSITIRAYKKTIEGLSCVGDYGVEGYIDFERIPVQDKSERIYVMGGYYFHTSYLQRSKSLRQDWEIPYRRGKVFAKKDFKVGKDFVFPEVFYVDRPKGVASPFKTQKIKYIMFRIMYILLKLSVAVKSYIKEGILASFKK